MYRSGHLTQPSISKYIEMATLSCFSPASDQFPWLVKSVIDLDKASLSAVVLLLVRLHSLANALG